MSDAQPPSYDESNKGSSRLPQHDWQNAVPDTSLLPPPPSVGYQFSPNDNATEDEDERGKKWCSKYPLDQPKSLPVLVLQNMDKGEIYLNPNSDFRGTVIKVAERGITKCVSNFSGNKDACLISDIPLYAVDCHSPFHIESGTKTIYFEILVKAPLGNPITVGLGFVAPPYPTFRLPGWHRASCGVHGDDGHKYVNNDLGGSDFTQAFKGGETLGIGMRFKLLGAKGPRMPRPDELAFLNGGNKKPAQGRPIDVDIFFTRNGKLDGRWNLHESMDSTQDLPVTGLEGGHDLFAAVGCWDTAEFDAIFKEKDWMFNPRSYNF